ncbi:MAG: ankyrin repeat domain-containing protein [Candidatus Thorarchaeota archaeon]|nr:MAG: ankyrin repeat domain-containing protein [Candidatus Thorarchaeota archaeon]
MTGVNNNLLSAAEAGDIEAVKKALDAGADINTQDNFLKESALHLAASKGHIGVVEYLIDNGADFFLNNGTDMIPLHLAARDGQVHVVKYLLEKFETIPERILNDVIHVAQMSVYGRPEIVLMLEDFRLDQARPIAQGGEKADSTLLEASENGNIKAAEQALEEGANVEVVDDRGMKPIHWASFRGHCDIVRILIDKGANVNGTNSALWTPIMHASLERHEEIVKLLLEKGADINSKTSVSGTALMFASGKGHLEVVKILLDSGADPTIEIDGTDSEDGMTAEVYARRGGYREIVELLNQVTNKFG